MSSTPNSADFILVHSPLAGPLTWSLVAAELERRGLAAHSPALTHDLNFPKPYWQQHAQAVARSIPPGAAARPPILVGHSGAGVLLPAIRQALDAPVAGYIFVDADLPVDGASRLDLFPPRSAADRFRRSAREGLVPTWTEADLQEVIPDRALRRRFVAELRPLPLAVYQEPIPVFAGWPDAPCGYLQFSATYDLPAMGAREAGWAYARLDGGHFHMLVDPPAVASSLVDLAGRMGAVPC